VSRDRTGAWGFPARGCNLLLIEPFRHYGSRRHRERSDDRVRDRSTRWYRPAAGTELLPRPRPPNRYRGAGILDFPPGIQFQRTSPRGGGLAASAAAVLPGRAK
jgi:hypothetical protein